MVAPSRHGRYEYFGAGADSVESLYGGGSFSGFGPRQVSWAAIECRIEALGRRVEAAVENVGSRLNAALIPWAKGAFEWVCNLLGIMTARRRAEGLISSHANLKVAPDFMHIIGADLRDRYAEADPGLIQIIVGVEELARSSATPQVRQQAHRLSGDGFVRKLRREWLEPEESRSFLASYQEVSPGLPAFAGWHQFSYEVQAFARASHALHRASRIIDHGVTDDLGNAAAGG